MAIVTTVNDLIEQLCKYEDRDTELIAVQYELGSWLIHEVEEHIENIVSDLQAEDVEALIDEVPSLITKEELEEALIQRVALLGVPNEDGTYNEDYLDIPIRLANNIVVKAEEENQLWGSNNG